MNLNRPEVIAVLRIVVNNKPKIIGKHIVLNDGKHILYRNYFWGTALFRKWDSLSQDSRLTVYCLDKVIEEIHYEHKDNILYVTSLVTFIESGRNGNWGEGSQKYLELSYWNKTERDYLTPWTENIIDLK